MKFDHRSLSNPSVCPDNLIKDLSECEVVQADKTDQRYRYHGHNIAHNDEAFVMGLLCLFWLQWSP